MTMIDQSTLENTAANAKDKNTVDFDHKDIHRIGLSILHQAARHRFYSQGFFGRLIMEWSMQRPQFKVQAFRFVDVLPSLNSHQQLIRHFKQYFYPVLPVSTLLLKILDGFLMLPGMDRLFAALVRRSITQMAQMFITGVDAQSAAPRLEKLWNDGSCFTVDILGEAVVSEKEAEDFQTKYLDLIEDLPRLVNSWKAQDLLEKGPMLSGRVTQIPRVNVSIKCSALFSMIDNVDFNGSVEGIKSRLRPLLHRAMQNNIFINLDMEAYDTKNILLQVAEDLFMEEGLREYPHFGVVIQAYLVSAQEDLQRVIKLSAARPQPLTVRLVKGAYWDTEVILAGQRAWPIPVWTQKAQSDVSYERCLKLLFENYPRILTAVASHNVRSLSVAFHLAQSLGVPKEGFEVQMLYGMADSFRRAVMSQGVRVREYAPIGEMIPGMAYLVRRLLENTANEGFLRNKFAAGVSAENLLANPSERISTHVSL